MILLTSDGGWRLEAGGWRLEAVIMLRVSYLILNFNIKF
jgi:hypothetical protein